MNLVARVVGTSLGKKYLMALTGMGLFLFAVFHMIGNLQVFLGRDALNHYGHLLKSNPEIIWPARVGLIACAMVHIATGVALTIENRQTRDRQYRQKKFVAASLASRTMLITGGIVLAYLIYHLLHFTLYATNPEFATFHDSEDRHDVYQMVIEGFRNPWASGFYILGVGLLSFHLSHGINAMLQSLGLKNHAYAVTIERFAKISAVALFVGYAIVPVAVLLGWVS